MTSPITVEHAVGGVLTRYGRNNPTPPPPAQKMLLGAYEPNISTSADWSARESVIGNMGIRRCFNTGFPSTWGTSAAAATSGIGMVNLLSMKPGVTNVISGSLDAAITSFVQSIPASEQVMLTIHHEPENDTGYTAAQWVQALQRFYGLVKAVRTDILVGPVLMGWTYDPASGRNPQSWNVTGAYCDFYGVDYYNGYHFPMTGNSPNWNAPINVAVTNFTNFCASIGVPGTFGELGCSEDTTLTYNGVTATSTNPNPQHKIDFIQAYIDHAHTNNYIGLCYFDVYKSGDTDPTIVLDSTAQTKAYWQSECAAHPARTLP